MVKSKVTINQDQSEKYQRVASSMLNWADTMLVKRQDEIQIKNPSPNEVGLFGGGVNLGEGYNTANEINRWSQAILDATFTKDPIKQARAFIEGRSYLKIPYIYAYIRGKTADEVSTMPYPKVLGTEYRDTETAYVFQKLMDYVVNNVLGLKKLMAQLYMTQKNVYGDGFLRFYWCREVEVYKKYRKVRGVKLKGAVKLDKDDEPMFKEYEVVTYENIKAEIVPIENLILDPTLYQSGKSIRDARRAGIFSYVLKEDFESIFKNKEGFFNLDLVKGGGDMNIVPSEIKALRNKTDKDFVEIYEGWDLNTDEHVYIADGVVIYYDACPYWNKFTKKKYIPVCQFVDNVSPLGMYNYGEPHMLHDIVEEKMTEKHINLDIAKYSGSMLFFDDMADVDIDAIQWRHGGVAKANDPNNSMKAVSLSANYQLPFANANSLQNDETIVSGHDVTGIIGGATGESATKTLERKESSMKITNFTNYVNEVGGFADAYMIIKNMILQFYTIEEFKNIAGEEGELLYELAKKNAKALKQDYDIAIVANNQIPATREIRKLRNQEALAMIMQIPIGEDGKVPAHIAPMYRQVLLDAEQPQDTIDKILGEGVADQVLGSTDVDDTGAREVIERMGYSPDEIMGVGAEAPLEVTRAGSQASPVDNVANSDIQKTSQNIFKY